MKKIFFILVVLFCAASSIAQTKYTLPYDSVIVQKPSNTGYLKGAKAGFSDTVFLVKLKFTDGSQSDGLVLTSDADGNAHWEPASGGGNSNSNVGSGYRWALPGTNDIKTFMNGYGLLLDSTSTLLTARADTFQLATRLIVQHRLDSLSAAIASGYVPNSRTITINGTSQDLSANRTYNVGTVTSVATNNGSGITGGTIAATGTIAADTTNVLATKARVMNVADSLGAIIATKGTGSVTSVATNAGSGITGGAITTSGTLAVDTGGVISTKGNVNRVADSLSTTSNAKGRAKYTVNMTTPDSLVGLGDSYTNSFGGITSFITMQSLLYTWTFTNLSLSGSGVWYAAKQANSNVFYYNNRILSAMAGLNDIRRGNGAATYRKIAGCYSSIIASQFVNTVTAANSGTKSGIWTSFTATTYGGRTSAGAFNNVSGSYIELAMSGSSFIVGYLSNASIGFTGGEIDIYVDGVFYKHVILDQADGISDGVDPNTICPGATLITGFSNASHTVRIVNTTNNYVYLDYFSTVKDATTSKPVLCYEIPYLNTTGYATAPSSGSIAVSNRGSDSINSKVIDWAGYPVVYIPTNSYTNNSTDMQSDSIHRNFAGSQRMAAAADASFRFVSVPLATTTVNGLMSTAAQSFAGNKNFTNAVQYSGTFSGTPTGASVEIEWFSGQGYITAYSRPTTAMPLNIRSSTLNFYQNGTSYAAAATTGVWSMERGMVINNSGAGSAFNGQTQIKSDNQDYMFYVDAQNDRIGLQTNAPTAKLHLAAGTATASTAPLKFTSGTNLTTAEAGAMEYNGTSLFFTPSATRQTIAFTDLTQTWSANQTFAGITGGSFITTASTNVNGNFYALGASDFSNSFSTSAYLFAGASNVQFRAGMRGSNSTVLTANTSASNFVMGEMGITEATSGTHALLAGMVLKAPVVTNGTATTTDMATLYINASPSGITPTGNTYAQWNDAGITRFDGSMQYNYSTTATSLSLDATHYFMSVSATGQTITLPTAVGITGREYTIKLTASGSGTVATTSSQTIDGSTTYSLASQYKYVTVISNGANWEVKANN